jgi:hypothetical protein
MGEYFTDERRFCCDNTPDTLRGAAFGRINLVTGIARLPASLLAGFSWQTVNPQAAFSGEFVCDLGDRSTFGDAQRSR